MRFNLYETDRWLENEIHINVLGLMNTHIFAAKQMVKQGFGGRIVGAGSIASYRTAENLGPYGGTKFAVRGFTEAAANEWAKYGIRVNGTRQISPSLVDVNQTKLYGSLRPRDRRYANVGPHRS